MMTIWDNMKQKSFSYLLVTHHGGMLCAVCQTFAVWWVDVLTHHICRMASRRDELQTWFAVAYVVDSQSVIPYCRGWWAFLENILHFTALQKHTFYVPKGALSACKRPCFGVPFAVFCKAGCFCGAGIRPAPLLLRISQSSTFHAISPLPYINYAVALLFFILPARKKNKFSIFVKKYPVRVMVRLPPLYAPRGWVS